MKSIKIYYLFLFLIGFCSAEQHIPSAITYQLNGGRFGDNLLSYSRAKWLCYIHGLRLHLRHFKYADKLLLYEKEQKGSYKKFKKIVRLSPHKKMRFEKNSTLYINSWSVPVDIDWSDEVFVAQLKELIAPRTPIEKIEIPADTISVAVHVRKGGGFSVDDDKEKQRCPLRFVPDEFFIAQIARLAEMFADKRLYVYIFTDDPNPEKIVETLSKAFKNKNNITFDCNKKENGYNKNVLDDFFTMMQFDCLIRPGSHFSRFVERLGDATLVIYPDSYDKKKNMINRVCIKKHTKDGWKVAKEKYIG